MKSRRIKKVEMTARIADISLLPFFAIPTHIVEIMQLFVGRYSYHRNHRVAMDILQLELININIVEV